MQILLIILSLGFGLSFGGFLIASAFINGKDLLWYWGCAGVSLILAFVFATIYHFVYEKYPQHKVIASNKISCSLCGKEVDAIQIISNDGSIKMSCPIDRTNCKREHTGGKKR